MKNYDLKSPPGDGLEPASRRLKPVGKIFFTFDKVFQNKWDKYPKFIPKKTFVILYENETAESCIAGLKKMYRNPRDFKMEMDQPELPTAQPELPTNRPADKISEKILPD